MPWHLNRIKLIDYLVGKAFKSSMIYVGTVIGAGFASGKEIAVYFDSLSPLTAFISGILLGAVGGFFMYAGYKGKFFQPPWFKLLTVICSYITLAAMCSGAGEIIPFPCGGILLTVLAVAAGVLGIKFLGKLNGILVPVIIFCILFLFFKNGNVFITGSYLPFKPILYSALNLLIAGSLMAEQGKNLTKREIVLSSALSAVIMSCLIFALCCLTIGNDSAMPLKEIASYMGFPIISSLLILLAIFTTMVSSAKLIYDYFTTMVSSAKLIYDYFKGLKLSPFFSSFMTLVPAVALSFIGFSAIVKYGYAFVSVAGLVLLFFTVLKMLPLKTAGFLVLKRKKKFSGGKLKNLKKQNERHTALNNLPQ